MRLGDLVINRNDPDSLTFQITGFDGDKAIVRVVDLPLTTVLPIKSLVVVSKLPIRPPFQVINGGS